MRSSDVAEATDLRSARRVRARERRRQQRRRRAPVPARRPTRAESHAMGPRARLSLRHALALGLAHGPTELLPISSSAHTILIPWLAGWPYAELDPELRKSFEVALHAGTAAALLTDLRSIEHRPRLATVARAAGTRQALLVALSFIPPAVAGYTFEQFLQRRLSGPPTIAAGLLLGGAAMALADARPQAGTHTLEQASVLDGLALGVAQACALVPGVSRSGAVLTAARARGFSRADSYTCLLY